MMGLTLADATGAANSNLAPAGGELSDRVILKVDEFAEGWLFVWAHAALCSAM